MGCREGGRAAFPGGNHNLAGVLLSQVSDNIYSGKVGFTPIICDHITVCIHFCTGRNQLVVRFKPDKNKDAIGFKDSRFFGFHVSQAYRSNPLLIGIDPGGDGIP